MPNSLQHYKILLADADQQLTQVLKTMLAEMGFTDVRSTRSGQEALSMLADTPFDFLITEWNLQRLDGMELLQRIRRDGQSPNPALPVVMLTGRAELADIVVARDHGINEYVVKPFSARTIYSRLERIVEHPRPFVASQQFVGPDRRRKGVPPPGMADRRSQAILPQRQPQNAAREVHSGGLPKVWLPDYSLKRKLGENVSLPSLITPAVLNLAQAAIDAITSDSLRWIKDNLVEIRALNQVMGGGDHSLSIGQAIGEVALTIRGRAGTFGYAQASEVAYMLYLFCRNRLQAAKAIHRTIVTKHIDVLQVMLGNDMRGVTEAGGQQIVAELHNLVNKYVL